MVGKYTPLEKYLRDLPKSQREVTFHFAQVEGILNSTLPSSTYETGASGIMRQKATTSMGAHGQVPDGRLRV
jgi:hypothetical protein